MTSAPDDTIQKLRKEYSGRPLDEAEVARDPFTLFSTWFDEAIASGLHEPNAMVLATVGKEGQPSARMLLLKSFDARGFRFYTNYDSRKGAELAAQPRAALLFYWGELERQVRIEGKVSKLSAKESAEYFATRPQGAQLSAAASAQSREITNRSELERAVAEVEQRYTGGAIPCPAHWGGYLLVPESFEFWQGRESRLHDRITYSRRAGSWRIARLAP